jgi:hypothetical protein
VGDRCQVNSDCQDDLLCVIPAGVSLAVGGTCQKPAAVADDLGIPPDLAAPPDLLVRDATALDQAGGGDGGADLSPLPDLPKPPADLINSDALLDLIAGG